MKVPVTWEMDGFVEVDATTMEEAYEKFEKEKWKILLPEDARYVEGSFRLSYDDPADAEYFMNLGKME